MRMFIVATAIGATLAGCTTAGQDGVPANRATAGVRLVMDEADAALAILEAPVPTAAQWDHLFGSEGYRRLKQREAAMQRGFEDAEFRAFLDSDSMRAEAPRLRRTVDEWRTADMSAAAARALAYLPQGSLLRARLYPVIKPRTNSFVFELNTDSAAIFMFVDPAVSRAQLENTLAHELHHVGYAAACERADDEALPAEVREVRRWIGAFGEGLAMLAAAGGVEIHPHAVSDSATRARWETDYSAAPRDLQAIEAFFFDVLAGRTSGMEIRQRAMAFFGDAQGPWYTVGYLMASTVERGMGREALIERICSPVALLESYNEAAARHNTRGAGPLPRWTDSLLVRIASR